MAFVDSLERGLQDRLSVYSSADGERMDIAAILGSALDDVVVYVCGPGRLVAAVTAAAKAQGIPRERVRTELFA